MKFMDKESNGVHIGYRQLKKQVVLKIQASINLIFFRGLKQRQYKEQKTDYRSRLADPSRQVFWFRFVNLLMFLLDFVICSVMNVMKK